jgi:GT2 family glycosyltransferase
MKKLAVVVLSFNTRDLLKDCLSSLRKVSNRKDIKIIVPDNDSKGRFPGNGQKGIS